MTEQISVDYNLDEKRATLTFANGRKLKLRGVTMQQAEEFVAKHGEEFAKRDCILDTQGTFLARGDDNG